MPATSPARPSSLCWCVRCACCRAAPLTPAQEHPTYDPARMHAFVADLTSYPLASTLAAHPFGRPTVVSLIFVLSAIPPRQHAHVMQELARCLPLGGSLIFRDFAHGDLSQLRYHMRKDKTWEEPSLLRDEEGDMAALYRRGTCKALLIVESVSRRARLRVETGVAVTVKGGAVMAWTACMPQCTQCGSHSGTRGCHSRGSAATAWRSWPPACARHCTVGRPCPPWKMPMPVADRSLQATTRSRRTSVPTTSVSVLCAAHTLTLH